MEARSNKESVAADSTVDEGVSSPGKTDDHAAAAAGAGDGDDAAAPVSSSPVKTAATATGTRPYYECVFCKRGFTTSQALGGHMNIHRRDRAKPSAARDALTTNTAITSLSRNVECYSQYRHLAAYPPAAMPVASSGAGAGTGVSSSGFAMYYGNAHGGAAAGVDGRSAVGPRELSLFDAATTTRDHSLHLGVGRSGGELRSPEGSEQQLAGELPERELDLELRLGRHTKH